jgi:hypothetical protein
MQRFDQTSREDLAETDYLHDYRAAVERLRGETAAEIGGQPMPPEKLSMFAVMIASLPLMAMLHPAFPLELHGWHDALALFAVWGVAFRVQNLRYARFHARWRGKIAAHQVAEFRSWRAGGAS